MSQHLSRRNVIRGLGGIAITLPILESLTSSRTAHAAGEVPKKRFVSCFAGNSMGDIAKVDGGGGFVQPSTVGEKYEITTALKPLETHGVQSLVGMVTGLAISRSAGDPGSINAPAPNNFHGYTLPTQLAGCRLSGSESAPNTATTCDQTVAQDLKLRTLNIRVQPVEYRGGDGGGGRGRISFAKGKFVDPYVSPRTLFQSLFAGLPVGANVAVAPGAAAAVATRRSILDLVDGRTKRLMGKVSAADRQTLDQHYTLLRQLEQDVSGVDPVGSLACKRPGDPGADPGGDGSGASIGYSGETERAKVMVDLIALGFACDLFQSVAFQVTFSQVFVSAKRAVGIDTSKYGDEDRDIHEIGHQGKYPAEVRAQTLAWAIDPFARLVAKLRDTKDPDGTRVIDSTALTMCFEGGWEGDEAHSVKNMMVLYGGTAGGLKPKHVRAVGRHPAEVIHAAMKAVGSTSPLGDFSSTIEGM